MILISEKRSWNTIDTTIQSKYQNELSTIPYLNFKECLFYNQPKNIIYVDSALNTDSLRNFVDYSQIGSELTVILSNTISNIQSYFDFNYSRSNDDYTHCTIIFKHNLSELQTLLGNLSSGVISRFLNVYNTFVVPTGLKTDYINEFDQLGNTYWDGLTAEEKSALITEGSEEY